MLKMTMGGVLPRLPTLGNGAAVLGADPTNAQPESDLGQLLAMYKRAEAERERGETMGAAKYIDNSGGVGVLAAIAQAAMGRHVRRKADETAEQLTGRILTAQQEAKQREATAAALAEEQGIIRKATTEKKLRTQTADELQLTGDARTRFIATGSLPSEPQWQYADSIPDPTNPNNVMSGWTRPGEIRALDGTPVYGGAAGASRAPTTGGGGAVLSDGIADAVQYVESRGNPNAISPKGARGLMQLMPATARELERKLGLQPFETDRDPEADRRAGEAYLAQMHQQFGDPDLALAAYNGGPGRMADALRSAHGDKARALAMMPSESREYVDKVQGALGAQPQGGQGGAGGHGAFPGSRPRIAPKDAPEWQQKIDYLKAHGVPEDKAIQAVVGGKSQRISVNPETGEVTIEDGIPGEMTTANRTKVQGEILDAQDALAQLDRVGKTVTGDYLTAAGVAKGQIGRTMDRLGMSNRFTEFNAKRGAALQEVEQFFNKYRKMITGAAAAESELKALREATINQSLGPQEFQARYSALINSLRADIGRKQGNRPASAGGGGNGSPAPAPAAGKPTMRYNPTTHRLEPIK